MTMFDKVKKSVTKTPSLIAPKTQFSREAPKKKKITHET